MRTSVILSITAAALTAVAIGSAGEAFAVNRKPAPVVRDHRAPATPVVRDHRTPKVVTRSPAAKKIHRADRNYDKSPKFKQVIVNGKRVPRRAGGGPVVRDHRQPAATVRDHRVTPR